MTDSAPRTPPPEGACIPIGWSRIVDGDTFEAILPSGRKVMVRPTGFDAPERNTPGGAEATHALESLLEQTHSLRIWLPWPEDTDNDGVLDLDEILHQWLCIGERIRPYVFADSHRVDLWMIEHGHDKGQT